MVSSGKKAGHSVGKGMGLILTLLKAHSWFRFDVKSGSACSRRSRGSINQNGRWGGEEMVTECVRISATYRGLQDLMRAAA